MSPFLVYSFLGALTPSASARRRAGAPTSSGSPIATARALRAPSAAGQTKEGCIVQVVNLKFSCGHFSETVVPGTSLTCQPYLLALRALPCHRCLGRHTAREQIRAIMDEERRAFYRKPA
jgi:hypothetical protein